MLPEIFVQIRYFFLEVAEENKMQYFCEPDVVFEGSMMVEDNSLPIKSLTI